jgi:hypothetical protein
MAGSARTRGVLKHTLCNVTRPEERQTSGAMVIVALRRGAQGAGLLSLSLSLSPDSLKCRV